MREPVSGREKCDQAAFPDGNPSALIDRIDHDECARAGSFAGSIERAQQIVRSDIGQTNLTANLTPNVAINKPAAQHKYRWEAPSDMMLRYIRDQLRFNDASFPGQKRSEERSVGKGGDRTWRYW